MDVHGCHVCSSLDEDPERTFLQGACTSLHAYIQARIQNTPAWRTPATGRPAFWQHAPGCAAGT